ncbi:MAG: YncE family protein, partial [Candidatus Kapaibacterium sp.]
MKIYLCLLAMAAALVLTACSSEEKVIDNSDTDWQLLAATQDSKVVRIKMPSLEVANPDVMATILGGPAPGNISKITEFRSNLYFLIPSARQIVIADKYDFSHVATIDFSAEDLEPTDICFPNATAAYVSHGNAASVSLVDITTFEVARVIAVGNDPRGITGAGNQVYVCNQADNSVSVIDTRTNEVAATILVSPYPTYVQANNAKSEMVVVSLGYGKLDETQQKSAAIVTFIDITTREKLAETALGFGGIDPVEQHPYGLAVSPKDWAFIPTDDYLLRIDARFHDRVMLAN